MEQNPVRRPRPLALALALSQNEEVVNLSLLTTENMPDKENKAILFYQRLGS